MLPRSLSLRGKFARGYEFLEKRANPELRPPQLSDAANDSFAALKVMKGLQSEGILE